MLADVMKIRGLSIGWVLIGAVLAFSMLWDTAKADELTNLITQIKQTPFTGDAGIDKRGQELAEKVAKYGARAVPLLLPLLQNENQNVRDLAGYTINEMSEGPTEKDLDALIEADRGKCRWLPRSIARIGTPKAIRYLAQSLRRVKSISNQYGGAFEGVLREKGVPYLVELYRGEEFDEELTYAMDSLFRALREQAELAIDPLLEIAADEKLPIKNRQAAVQALGAIGPKTRRAIPSMRALAQKSPDAFKKAMECALSQMGVPESVDVFVGQLKREPQRATYAMRDIAELCENGRGAGAVLLPYLKSEDWGDRVAAVRTMGCIGYAEAVPDLIQLLDNPEDWRVVWASAESLGMIRDKAALPTLRKVSQTYWYPCVREAAAIACRAIEGSESPANLDKRYGVRGMEFYWYDSSHRPDNFKAQIKEAREQMERMGVVTETQSDLEMFKKVWFKSYFYDGKGIRRRPNPSEAIPAARGKAEGGFVVGWDQGEWGGDLLFVGLDGSDQRISDDNVRAIHSLKEEPVVVAGMSHLGREYGRLLKLKKDASGKWKAVNWRALPGAPVDSALLKDGKLMVICYSGTVTVTPEGMIEWVNLKSQHEPKKESR